MTNSNLAIDHNQNQSKKIDIGVVNAKNCEISTNPTKYDHGRHIEKDTLEFIPVPETTKQNLSLFSDYTKLCAYLEKKRLFKPSKVQLFFILAEICILAILGYSMQYLALSMVTILIGTLLFSMAQFRLFLLLHEASRYSLSGVKSLDGFVTSVMTGMLLGCLPTFWKLHFYSTNITKMDGYSTKTWKYLQYSVGIVCSGLHFYLASQIGFITWGATIVLTLASVWTQNAFLLACQIMRQENTSMHAVPDCLAINANVGRSSCSDWLMAYANYSIESNLFPTMPSYHYPQACLRVKNMAYKHGYPYHVLSYKNALLKIISNILNIP